MEMTNEAKTVQIAEAVGWCVKPDDSELWTAHNEDGQMRGFHAGLNKDHAERVCYPHYFTSLDACAEARAKLTEEQQWVFTEWLIDEVGADRKHLNAAVDTTWKLRCRELFKLNDAKTEHIAEALFKTLCPT